MEKKTWEKLQAVFQKGLPLDQAGRDRLLNAEFPDQPEPRAEVEALWRYERVDPFNFDALPDLSRAFFLQYQKERTRIPTRVHGYQIVDIIARGGMSTVYKAEQQQPQRTVALKIMAHELVGEEFTQRFQAELHALALMAHKNVAAVHEAGMTEEGLPFFAMEYLEALTLTRYCDKHRLNLEERLKLFLQVCEGVQHAHQKGIIHRDIKPSNILVTIQDGEPVPKLIDFGIAKLLDETQTPFRTKTGAVLGTPAYMSPEQASGAKEDVVDTRSDIYALGLLLYELLVGVGPYDKKMEDAVSFHAQCRMIVEAEPTRPSMSLEADGNRVRRIASYRQTDPRGLRAAIRDDLDWITMKALAKNPVQRYSACGELMADVHRHLNSLPVEAGPPGYLYPLKKFVTRHRRGVFMAVVLTFALLVGFAATAIALYRVSLAERAALASQRRAETALARLQAVNDFTLGIFRSVTPYRRGAEVTGVALLDHAAENLAKEYAGQPEIEAATRMVLGGSYEGLGMFEKARNQYERALNLRRESLGETHEETLQALEATAFVLFEQAEFEQAQNYYSASHRQLRAALGPSHPKTLRAASGLALVWKKMEKTEEARNLFEETLAAQQRVLVREDPQTLATRNNFADLLLDMGEIARAESLFQQNLDIYQSLYGEKFPNTLASMHNLALAYQKQGKLEQAEKLYRQAWDLRREVLGAQHPESLVTLNNLATTLGAKGHPREAVALLETVSSQKLEGAHLNLLLVMHNLGHHLVEIGDYIRADSVLQKTLAARSALLGESHYSTLLTQCTLAESYQKQGDIQAAKALLRDALDKATKAFGPDHRHTVFFKRLQIK